MSYTIYNPVPNWVFPLEPRITRCRWPPRDHVRKKTAKTPCLWPEMW